jgi:hypothetical protein
MSYQVGQAAISKNNGLLYFIHRIDVGGSFNYNYLTTIDGIVLPVLCYDYEIRTATEAEILEQAVKHGWTVHNIININSPSADVYLERDYANSPWRISHAGFVEDYSIFGQECIAAHRLITALNLTK